MAQDELCLDVEEWRDVVGQETKYEVSSRGRVRSKDRVEKNSLGRARHLQGKELTHQVYKTGDIVIINHNDKLRVDELVANAFVAPGKPGQMVLHLDGDEQNFDPSNLAWVDEKTYFEELYKITYGYSIDEEWRDVVGYEGLYQVSNLGVVRCTGRIIHAANGTIIRRLSQPMKPIERGYGGCAVSLVRHNEKVHEITPVGRIVADAFIPCHEEKMILVYLNDDVTDNRACNLAWVDQTEYRKSIECADDCEEWRSVVGYEGLYEVSSNGGVRSVDHRVDCGYGRTRLMHGRMIRQTADRHGYMHVMLYKNGVGTTTSVHRIVAEAFLDNENNLPEIDHINAIRNDNRATNLRYVTSKENKDYRVKYSDTFTSSRVDRTMDKSEIADDAIDGEEWRDIEGYEGLYQVSDLGRVRSLPRRYVDSAGRANSKPGIVLRQKLNVNGYSAVWLFKDGKRHMLQVHRLVAKAFLSNPDNLPVVDHINFDRTDARACNLRWCTQADNVNFAVKNGRIPYDVIIPKLKSEASEKKRLEVLSKPVIRSDGKIYSSQIEAARDLGYVSEGPIRSVATGAQQSCKGYTFKYI